MRHMGRRVAGHFMVRASARTLSNWSIQRIVETFAGGLAKFRRLPLIPSFLRACVIRWRDLPSPHLRQGRLGERIACRHLLREGYDVLARRFRGRYGEVDLVALDGPTLVFVEVKTRATRNFGDPSEFVDQGKQQRFRLAAEEFVSRYDLGRYAYRFDIVAVVAPSTTVEEVEHFANAF
jgi:putative endonuclease